MRRMIAAATIVLCLGAAGVAAAAEVTFVLNNGERHTGTLVYHSDTNIGLIMNGRERSFPARDVAVIIYNDGDPNARELAELPTSDNPPELERHTLVLRNGRVIRGKVYHWNPDSVMFDSLAGRGTYNASDVARLYLSGPPARRVFADNNPAQVAGNSGRYGRRGAGRAGGTAQASVRVEANQPWTDTGLVVQQGERIAFSTDGTITFGKDMTAGPDGNKDLPARASYPVREMPVGGLIGRVGNGRPFAIGSTRTPIVMPAGGRLMLGTNDDALSDNSGAFDVQVYRR
jgi:hypothetical protein